MRRPNPVGHSVYISRFVEQKPLLEQMAGKGAMVFTSLHIQEEFSSEYCNQATEICHWLAQNGFRVIADVSPKTAEQFGTDNMPQLAEQLKLYGLRLDDGYSDAEIEDLARRMPIALNASTIDVQLAARCVQNGGQVVAMHNYYPRPETGLDDDFMRRTTQKLHDIGVQVYAFIPGDETMRGPLFKGLPTLEGHRGIPPLAAFAQLHIAHEIDGIFVGDVAITPRQRALLAAYADTGVLPVPARVDAGYPALYEHDFTCRQDSPAWAIRFAESRFLNLFGKEIAPGHTLPRHFGDITIDNKDYGRYVGELQIMRGEFPQNPCINVIGEVLPAYHSMLGCIQNGMSFRLVPENTL